MSNGKKIVANRVLIASNDGNISTRFTEILNDKFELTLAAAWGETITAASRYQHQVVILDPVIIRQYEDVFTSELFTVSPDIRIVILETIAGPVVDQVKLFKMGVHGFFHGDISPELLCKAVHAVSCGELWMQRSLITRVIDDMARNRQSRTEAGAQAGNRNVECLTPRELEVARMVHQGGNNKTIARKLEISERTVKAHLSAIFRKLDIENRLHLAIYFNDVP
ncbi:MAG: response regulator transcription factor [Saprospiraceae bacterium]|nr:response regulator transcription factor [Saprospiraceae bacterium]